jgi:hypothetical protein
MAGDIHYPSVSVLLPCDGANDSAVISDLSLNPKAVRAFGGARISSAQSLFGKNTLLLNGTTSFVEVAHSPDFSFGSGDFSVECWIYPIAAPTVLADLVCTNRATAPGNGWSLRLRPGMNPIAGFSTDGNDYIGLEGSVVIPLNAWAHVKADRVGSSLSLRVNGAVAATGVIPGAQFDTAGPIVVGRNPANASWYFTGRMAQIRATKGVGRNAEAVPVGPFPNYAGQITGNVKDAAGLNAARSISVWRESTGVLIQAVVSDETTGIYTVNTPDLNAHTVTAYPGAGENLPALTLRGVVPL